MTPVKALHAAVAAVVVVWLGVVALWGPAAFALTFDDAFYYFQIARNVAAGHGSTFNGIDDTNGYHPLWLAICTLPYVAGIDGMAAVRVLLVLQLALYAATLVAIVAVLGRTIAGWSRLPPLDRAGDGARRCSLTLAAAFVLVAGNPFVVKTFVNGLESAITCLAYAVVLLVVGSDQERVLGATSRERAALAAALVVAFLGRTDALIVVGCLGLWALAARPRVRPMVEVFAPVGVVAVAYLAANQVAFGNPLQISGVVKRLPMTGSRAAALAAVAMLALAVAAAARRIGPPKRFPHVSSFVRRTGFFAAACTLLLGYYRVLSAEVYLWYYAPLVLYAVLLLLHATADLVEGAVVEARPGQPSRAALAPIQLVVGIPVALGLAFSLRQLVDPHQRSLALGDKAAAEWVAHNTDPTTVIASWDAGIIGYFSERPVVNLDGVVSSFDWERATRGGTAATAAFLRDRRVAYVVNHGDVREGLDPDMPAAVDRLFGNGVGGAIELVHREDYRYAGAAGGSGRGDRPFATFVYRLPPPR